ncbi:mucin-4 isoform X2 [Procambarus clarkii]|uniref:mucin-4 isoform X2 n=1 Tax=Procambarus clarkii TaxID=6728 RepID=UPI00374445F8
MFPSYKTCLKEVLSFIIPPMDCGRSSLIMSSWSVCAWAWSKRHRPSGSSSFKNQEFHWQGIVCMRQVWSVSGSSAASHAGQVACLEAIIRKSVMTSLQIVKELSCAMHIPWCKEILDAVKSVLALSQSFSIHENEKDVENNNKQTSTKGSKTFCPSSVNSTKEFGGILQKYLKKERRKEMLAECKDSANSLYSGIQGFPDLTSALQTTALPPLTDHINQSEPVKEMKFNKKSRTPMAKKKKTPQVIFRRGINLDANHEQYLVPLQQGWVREIVYRAVSETSRSDIYYHPPSGKKLRSCVDVNKYLEKENVQDLTVANFTFRPLTLGFGPPHEICRNAKFGITFFGKTHSNRENESKTEDMNIASSTASTKSSNLNKIRITSPSTAIKSSSLKPKKIVSSPTAFKSTNLLSGDGRSKHTLKENGGFEVTNEVGETTGYEDWIPRGNVLRNMHHGKISVTVTDNRNKTPLMSNSEKSLLSEKEIMDELCKEKQISDFEFEMATKELECQLKMKIIKKTKKCAIYTNPKKAKAKSVSYNSSLRSKKFRYSKPDRFINQKKNEFKNVISKEPSCNVSPVTPVCETDQQCLSHKQSEYNGEILGLELNTTQSQICNNEISNTQSEVCNIERKNLQSQIFYSDIINSEYYGETLGLALNTTRSQVCNHEISNTQSEVCKSDSLSHEYTLDFHENIIIKSEENLYDACNFKQELHSVSENHNSESIFVKPSIMYPIDIKCEPLCNTPFENNDGVDLNMLKLTPEESLSFSSDRVNNYEESEINFLDSNSHEEDITETLQDTSLPVISQIQSGKEVEELFEEPLRLWNTPPFANSMKPPETIETTVHQPVTFQSSNSSPSTNTTPLQCGVTSLAQESPVAEDALQRKLQKNTQECLSRSADKYCSSIVGIKNKIFGIESNVAVVQEGASNRESHRTFRKLTNDKRPKRNRGEIHIPQNQEIMLPEKVSNLTSKLSGSVEQENRMSQPTLHSQASTSKQVNLPVQQGQIQPHHISTGQVKNTLRTFRKLNRSKPATSPLGSKTSVVPLHESNIKSQPPSLSGQINISLRKFRILPKNKFLALTKRSIEQANNSSQEKELPTQPSKSSEHVINFGSQKKNLLSQPTSSDKQVFNLASQQKDMVTVPLTQSRQIQNLTSPKNNTAQLSTSNDQVVNFTSQHRNVAKLSTSNEQVINSVSQQENIPTQLSPSIRQSYSASQKSLPTQLSTSNDPLISSVSKKMRVEVQPSCEEINAPQTHTKITPTHQSSSKGQVCTTATRQLESIQPQTSSKKVLNVTFVSTSVEKIKKLIFQSESLPVQLDNGQTI